MAAEQGEKQQIWYFPAPRRPTKLGAMEGEFKATDRSTVRRVAERGSHDRARAYAILDEGLVCHVGLTGSEGPVVIPMGYARDGDDLLLHGSVASRLMQRIAAGAEICVGVTLLDALVLARSTFHHSMNYRSVVIFGRGARVDDEAEKRRCLDRLVEHLVPGRSVEARAPNRKELAATLLVRLPLEEASVKIRSGPPSDNHADQGLPIWAGLIPLETTPAAAVPDEFNQVQTPAYVANYSRKGG